MKNSKKIFLISVFSIFVCFSVLIPSVRAQEWVYDGIDTTNIPGSSVYPSEWYIYEQTEVYPPTGAGVLCEIVKGNTTVQPLIGNCTSVWGDMWAFNITSGEKVPGYFYLDQNFGNWNETFGFYTVSLIPFLIPVENNGIVSLPILNNVSVYWEMSVAYYRFEEQQIFPNINSFRFWNVSNNVYISLNYTDDGILTRIEMDLGPFPTMGNWSLYSQPAQLPPSFSFTTESGNLNVNSTDLKLVVDITDADNNNDGIIDTDYQYRIYNGAVWTAWAAIPSVIDYSLGSVSDGNYDITMEVKNMYGVTSKQIQVQYTAPSGNGTPPIPGYSIVITSIALLIGISFLIQKNRKKL